MIATVVSSCSARGWREYGRRFVESYVEHWPASIPLRVYSEDVLEGAGQIEGDGERVTFHYLLANKKHARWFDRHAANRRARGRSPNEGGVGWTPGKLERGYNFRLDAYKFAKKVFALQSAAHALAGGRMFWLDADTVTFAPVPCELLDEVMPEGYQIAHLNRGTYHSECGFVGYNLGDIRTLAFIDAFADLYLTGAVFKLNEWHDSWVFDWLSHDMGMHRYAIPHCSDRQPFINSVLGRYMDHMKGASKVRGKTREDLMRAGHTNEYWRS